MPTPFLIDQITGPILIYSLRNYSFLRITNMADTSVQNLLVLDDEIAATPAEYYAEYSGNGYNQSNANILILDENRETGSVCSDVCDGDKQIVTSQTNAVYKDGSDDEDGTEVGSIYN